MSVTNTTLKSKFANTAAVIMGTALRTTRITALIPALATLSPLITFSAQAHDDPQPTTLLPTGTRREWFGFHQLLSFTAHAYNWNLDSTLLCHQYWK